MEFMIAGAVLFGLIPGVIANSKGHSFLLWWLFGAAMLIIALPCSIFLKNISGKKCPQCAEYVETEAIICKHCQSKFVPVQ